MKHLSERLDALCDERAATVVNVFSSGGTGGNPCPVVLNAGGMTPDAMRAVAQAYGYESAFVFPLSMGDDQADLALRYFVPEGEMEMCGHATLGAVWLLRQANVIDNRIVRVRTAAGIVLADTRYEQIRISQPAATVRELEAVEKRQVLALLGSNLIALLGSNLTFHTTPLRLYLILIQGETNSHYQSRFDVICKA